MTQLEKDYQVFNPGAPASVALTIQFGSVADAAWVERCIVEAKRDGRLSALSTGILFAALHKAVGVSARGIGQGNQNFITPEQLKAARLGQS